MQHILEKRKREALERRKQRRKEMPLCVKWVEAMREHFPELRILYAKENGYEWGEKQPRGVPMSVMQRTSTGGWFK